MVVKTNKYYGRNNICFTIYENSQLKLWHVLFLFVDYCDSETKRWNFIPESNLIIFQYFMSSYFLVLKQQNHILVLGKSHRISPHATGRKIELGIGFRKEGFFLQNNYEFKNILHTFFYVSYRKFTGFKYKLSSYLQNHFV